MSCLEASAPPVPDVLARLHAAGSAEEFFAILGVAYNPHVLDVARLHILKRMGEYLASEDVEGLPDSVAAARCRAVLARAYDEFTRSSPLEQRVFKVLKTAVEPRLPKNFLPFDALE